MRKAFRENARLADLLERQNGDRRLLDRRENKIGRSRRLGITHFLSLSRRRGRGFFGLQLRHFDATDEAESALVHGLDQPLRLAVVTNRLARRLDPA